MPGKSPSKNPFTIAPGLARSSAYGVCTACAVMSSRVNHIAKELGVKDEKNLWLLIAITNGTALFSQSKLGQALSINPNAMVKRVDFLEKRGFLKRVANEQNRREWLLRTTPKTQRLVGEYLSHTVDISKLEPEEMATLNQLAIKIINKFYLP